MNLKRPLTLLAPVLVFVLGVAAGIGVSALFVNKHLKDFVENGPISAVRYGTAAFANELDLDPSQRELYAPLADRVENAFRQMHHDDLARVRVLFEGVADELRPHLNAEQNERMESLLADPRRRWDKYVGPETPATSEAPADRP